MAEKPFDPTHGVRFDLPNGSVRAGDAGREVLVPAAALAELAKTASTATVEAFARAIGRAIGERAAARLGNASGSSIDGFAQHLGGEAAMAGVGVLVLERWGRAMVIALANASLPEAMIAPAVAAMIEASTGREVWCALLMHDAAVARVVVTSRAGASRVRHWIDEGTSWGDALVRLHAHAPGPIA